MPHAHSLAIRWLRRVPGLRKLLLAVALPVAAAHAHAQMPDCPPVPQMPDAAELQHLVKNARDRGLLWRVQKDGRTHWLYGTIHVAQRDWMVPGPTVLQALRSADSLALELNVLDPQVMQSLLDAMRAQPDAKPLPGALAGRLEKQKAQQCLGAEVSALRPDAQVITLSSLTARREGLDPAYGIDLTLAGAAHGMKKPVIGLESVQTQIGEMISNDPAKVIETVSTALDQLERGDAGDKLATIARAWADGRLGLIETYPQWCDCLNTPQERQDYQRVVVERNPGMARALIQQIDTGKTVFAAVGTLHMVGPRGLPALLKARGFQVERVEFPPHSPH